MLLYVCRYVYITLPLSERKFVFRCRPSVLSHFLVLFIHLQSNARVVVVMLRCTRNFSCSKTQVDIVYKFRRVRQYHFIAKYTIRDIIRDFFVFLQFKNTQEYLKV